MAGTWQTLTNAPPAPVATTFLLTDGTVLAQGVSTNQWYRLSPDASGSYANGTWTTVASSVHAPLYYASGVLRDGRVIVVGGEYDAGNMIWLLGAEIFDPVANTWTTLPTPAGWVRIGDAPGCVLPDGRFIVGQVNERDVAIYDPATNVWTAAAQKINRIAEESWSLLPDGSIHAVDCTRPPEAEKYVIAADTWVAAGSTPQVLVDSITEIGASVLLPDGRVFVIGATGYTALYTPPPIANQVGTWDDGPTIPQVNPNQPLGAVDAPACVLPNGNVLFSAGPITTPASFQPPTFFFEYDPVANAITAVPGPSTSADRPYVGRLLVLPTGQAMYTAYDARVDLYTPSGAPDPVWLPTITSVPSSLRRGGTYTLHGRQINGLTQCSYYGNDATNATNYPLVRLRARGAVYYCRTSDYSTMGLNTGTIIHDCRFTVPSGIPLGTYCLEVVVNGIASACETVGVTRKWFKEVKLEIKEKVEIIDNLKEVRDLNTKRIPDITDDKQIRENVDILEQVQNDWVQTVKKVAESVDRANEELSRSFITPDERPVVQGARATIEKIVPRRISAAEAKLAQEKRAFPDERRASISKEAQELHEFLHSLSRMSEQEAERGSRTFRKMPAGGPDSRSGGRKQSVKPKSKSKPKPKPKKR